MLELGVFACVIPVSLLLGVSCGAQDTEQGLSWSPVLFGKDWAGKQQEKIQGQSFKGCEGGREDEACYLQKESSDNSGMRDPYKEEDTRQVGLSHDVEVFEMLYSIKEVEFFNKNR